MSAEAELRERAERGAADIMTILRRRIEALSERVPDPVDGSGLPRVRIDESLTGAFPLSIMITVRTDTERDALKQDPTVEAELRAALMDGDYPALDRWNLAFLSQESADRDTAIMARNRRACDAIRPVLRRHIEALFGPIPAPQVDGKDFPYAWLDERLNLLVLVTRTDIERDALKRQGSILADVRAAIHAHGYPTSEPTVECESQETIDNRFDGNWWYWMK